MDSEHKDQLGYEDEPFNNAGAATSYSNKPEQPPASGASEDFDEGDDDMGSRVQVMVRIRPQSTLEKETNQPVIITAPNNTELRVRQSRKGLTAADKTYNFDNVFNSHSTQEEVFRVAIEPLVTEVLQGFNCTVFAYGPTGTGKTHTMEGTLSSDANDKDAGVIPRCVHAIFDRLQKTFSEFSVKVSFLELYNEELCDLLVEGEERPLRIFEDSTGKSGITISGLEEVVVTSPEQVFALLRRSQLKRRVAETNLNKNSSRSHCVFTITIHGKETGIDNDDVIRTGKLHLVDLAGSECIGRSGAQNIRAKEAGKINQSLLTLGRVITALVEKHGYIPYRDSKLTRLLQESLGGRSKTCIIATVSPAAMCIDESLSTLDYASRAKHIKNKPQVTQKVSKKSYFRDLVNQIARLKAENEALRCKNGVFLPPDQYEELTEGYRSKCSQLEEAEFALQAKEKELAEFKELFDVKAAEVTDLTRKVEDTQNKLEVTRHELSVTSADLRKTAIALDETNFVVAQQAKTEGALSEEASQLSTVLSEVLTDKQALHAKLDRKQARETSNLAAVADFATRIGEQALGALRESVDEDIMASTKAHNQLKEHITTSAEQQISSVQVIVQQAEKAKQAEVDQVDAIRSSVSQFAKDTQASLTSFKAEQVAVLEKSADGIKTEKTETISAIQSVRADASDASVRRMEALDAMRVSTSDFTARMVGAESKRLGQVNDWYAKESAAIESDTAKHFNSIETIQTESERSRTEFTNSIASTSKSMEEDLSQFNASMKQAMKTRKEHAIAAQERSSARAAQVIEYCKTASKVAEEDGKKFEAALATVESSVNAIQEASDRGLTSLTTSATTLAHLSNQSHITTAAAFAARGAAIERLDTQIVASYSKSYNAMATEQKQRMDDRSSKLEQQLDAFSAMMERKLEEESKALTQSIVGLISAFTMQQRNTIAQQVAALKENLLQQRNELSADHAARNESTTAFTTELHTFAAQERAALKGHEQQEEGIAAAESAAYNALQSVMRDLADELDQGTAEAHEAIKQVASLEQQQRAARHEANKTLAHSYADRAKADAQSAKSEFDKEVETSNCIEASVSQAHAERAKELSELSIRINQVSDVRYGSLGKLQGDVGKARERAQASIKSLSEMASAASTAAKTSLNEFQAASDASFDAAAAAEKESAAAESAALQQIAESISKQSDALYALVGQTAVHSCRSYAQSLQTSLEEYTAASRAQAHELESALEAGFSELKKSSLALCDEISDQTQAGTQNLEKEMERSKAAHDSFGDQVSHIARAIESLARDEVRPDVPTGTTPVRRKFQFPRAITRTKPHTEILSGFRECKGQKALTVVKPEAQVEPAQVLATLPLKTLLDLTVDVNDVRGQMHIRAPGSPPAAAVAAADHFEAVAKTPSKFLGPVLSLASLDLKSGCVENEGDDQERVINGNLFCDEHSPSQVEEDESASDATPVVAEAEPEFATEVGVANDEIETVAEDDAVVGVPDVAVALDEDVEGDMENEPEIAQVVTPTSQGASPTAAGVGAAIVPAAVVATSVAAPAPVSKVGAMTSRMLSASGVQRNASSAASSTLRRTTSARLPLSSTSVSSNSMQSRMAVGGVSKPATSAADESRLRRTVSGTAASSTLRSTTAIRR